MVETLHRSMHEILGSNLLFIFKGDVVWSFFLPYAPNVKENKKIIKIKNANNNKKWSGDMVKGTFPPNLALKGIFIGMFTPCTLNE